MSDSEGPNLNCSETHATFRIVGDNVVPEEVTKYIGIIPDFSQSASSDPKRPGLWSLRSERLVISTRLEDHLRNLLDRLSTAKPIHRQHFSSGTRIEFHCYWMSATGHGGPMLSHELLAALSTFEAGLDFDFYCAE